MFRRFRHGRRAVLALASVSVLVPVNAGRVSAESVADGAQASESRSQRTLDKMARGVAGMATGVLELPGQMVEETRENGLASGLTVGVAKGLGGVVTRELVGFYQFASAPFDKPDGLDAALAHRYPWDYFHSFFDVFDRGESRDLAKQEQEFRWIRGAEIERHDDYLRIRFPSEFLFGLNSSTLSSQADPRLIGLAETLKRNPGTVVRVVGYTDASGSVDYNRMLSEQRARAVSEMLVSKGIAEDRIEIDGLGPAAPVADNETREGRRRNRRVEIEVRHASQQG